MNKQEQLKATIYFKVEKLDADGKVHENVHDLAFLTNMNRKDWQQSVETMKRICDAIRADIDAQGEALLK